MCPVNGAMKSVHKAIAKATGCDRLSMLCANHADCDEDSGCSSQAHEC